MGNLLSEVREFWYNNVPGEFNGVSRKEIHTYGGPNPKFKCEICQESEWMSRITQSNLFTAHKCSTSNVCRAHCQRQGDELWTNLHQNFWYAAGCNPKLNAPKILLIHCPRGPKYMNTYNCDHSTKVFLRRIAQACQYDITTDQNAKIDWSRYDGAIFFITGQVPKLKTSLPVIAYAHDLWKHHNIRQGMIDFYQPDILLTPYPTPWQFHYKIPEKTKVVFHPISASQFFTRPNLSRNKKYDLVVAGSMGDNIYKPRLILDSQVKTLRGFNIKFSHHPGSKRAYTDGPVSKGDVHYMNKWSEFLGSGKFVMFGPIDGFPQAVFHKHYECMGSGAIPIIPTAPDLKLLGVEPMIHYIPVQSIMGDNKGLTDILNSFEDLRYIAKNAVKWHEQNADRMMFEGFEDAIQELTNNKYPRRLIT